jgi:hypothetical protein
MQELFESKRAGLKWTVVAALVLVSAVCKAQDAHCAWLNDATAAGVLNGKVNLDLETAPDDATICTFTNLRTAKDYSTIRIMVQPLKDTSNAVAPHESLCTSPAVAVKAMGNEAVTCSADVGYSRGEQVIGRVRDRLFIVTVSSTMAHDPEMTRQMLKDKAHMVAEQLAGALF